jgi:hypothetical protein
MKSNGLGIRVIYRAALTVAPPPNYVLILYRLPGFLDETNPAGLMTHTIENKMFWPAIFEPQRASASDQPILAKARTAKIGSYCHIGHYTFVMDNDQHDVVRPMELPKSDPVIMEDHVWIGSKAIIFSGARVGSRPVIGAGSIVIRDVPARFAAAGNPARVLCHLRTSTKSCPAFSAGDWQTVGRACDPIRQEQIRLLLRVRGWDE